MPKHLPEDERSFSRNVASLKNMIQGKTNCCFESNEDTFQGDEQAGADECLQQLKESGILMKSKLKIVKQTMQKIKRTVQSRGEAEAKRMAKRKFLTSINSEKLCPYSVHRGFQYK